MTKTLKAGQGPLKFVSIDPVENPRLWSKSRQHKTRRFILVAPGSNSQLEHLKAFHQTPGGLLAVAARTAEIKPDIECIIVDTTMGDEFPVDLEPEKDLVGITANTAEANFAYAWAVKLRKEYPALPIIGGGPHFTFQTEEAMNFFDVVIQGESEGILPRFFEDLNNGNLQQLYDGRQEPIQLDRPDFPVPDPGKLLQKPEEYGTNILLTSRGCNNNCTYCSLRSFLGKGIRFLTMQRVRKQLEYLPKKPVLYVVDDNLMANRERMIELAGLLKSMNISWLCHSTMTIGDDIELLKIIGKSGCFMVVIGIESIEEKYLRSIGKGHVNKPKNYERQLKNIRNIGGMGVYGGFMLWGDGFVYPDSVQRLADWIPEQKAIEIIQFTMETPLPGTRLMKMREKQDCLLDTGPFGKKITWDDYNCMQIVQKIPGVSPEQAQKALHWLYGRLYGMTPLSTLKFLPGFLKTHFIHGHSGFRNKLIGTVFPYAVHTGAKKILKLHEMETPEGKVSAGTLEI